MSFLAKLSFKRDRDKQKEEKNSNHNNSEDPPASALTLSASPAVNGNGAATLPLPPAKPALPLTPPVRSKSGGSISSLTHHALPPPAISSTALTVTPVQPQPLSPQALQQQQANQPSSSTTPPMSLSLTSSPHLGPRSSLPLAMSVLPPINQFNTQPVSFSLSHSQPLLPFYSASQLPPPPMPQNISLLTTHGNASFFASANDARSNPVLDNLCRTAESSDVHDQLCAARLFLEQASTLDERKQSEIAAKAMIALGKLAVSSNTTVQTHAIQTIALLARNKGNHPAMIQQQYLQKLLDQLSLSKDARVVEAILAALTHLAKTPNVCQNICQRGFSSLLPLLDTKQNYSVGVQCNALALIGTLASQPELIDTMIHQDVLYRLFLLRDGKNHYHSASNDGDSVSTIAVQPDIQLNARYCLRAMGYSEDDPPPTYIAMVDSMAAMGFPRGAAELAMRQVRANKGAPLSMDDKDKQAVSTALLDNDIFHQSQAQSPQPLASSQPLPPPPSSQSFYENSVSVQPSLSFSQSSSHQPLLDDSKDLEAQMRRDKITGLKRVAREREGEINQLLDFGFSRKDAIFALYYQQNLDSAIEWIMHRQKFVEERAKRNKRSMSGSSVHADDEDDSKAMMMERVESNEHGYDSEGIDISEFRAPTGNLTNEFDSSPSTITRRATPTGLMNGVLDDDWEHVNMTPTFIGPQRTASEPQQRERVESSPLPASLDEPGLPLHQRSQSSMPAIFAATPFASLPPAASAADDRSAMLDWLSLHGFGEYSKNFHSQKIGVSTLAMLTDNDLMDLGMKKIGDRRRFMLAIREQSGGVPLQRNTSVPTISQPTSPPARYSLLLESQEEFDSGSVPSNAAIRPQSPLTEHQSAQQANHLSVMEGDESESNDNDASPSPSLSPLPAAPVHSDHSKRKGVDFAFLQSMPLRHSEVPGISKKLDLSKEAAELQAALNESGKKFTVSWEIATKDNLLKMMQYSRALHISGHGDPNALVLEDGKGDLAPLPVDKLQRILDIGRTKLKFVFVSSCFSSRAAYAFAIAGVPHVIAVQEDTQVTDTNARAFAHHVYLALCQGLTVRQAFDNGRAAVIANQVVSPPCCCAHLHTAPQCSICTVCRSPVCCAVHSAPCHRAPQQPPPHCCQPALPHDESLKFLLLPANADHDVPLFKEDEVQDGAWVNKSTAKPTNNLPSGPDDFMGRAKDGLAIVPQILRHRLFLITGPRGVGKSALARYIATYINDRRHFSATFLVKLQDARSVEAIDQSIAKVVHLHQSSDPGRLHDAIVNHLKAINTDNKPFLFVFDDCDLLCADNNATDPRNEIAIINSNDDANSNTSGGTGSGNSDDNEKKRAFRAYIGSFLDDTPSHILFTSDRSPGSIDGHTLRVHTLHGLHALDLAALFVNRLPRDIKPDDLRQHLKRVSNLNDLLAHPLFSLMGGLPRMAEWCAELLNYTNMDSLYSLLSQNPVVDSIKPHVIRDNPNWPAMLTPEARTLIKKCQALMRQRRHSWDTNNSSQNATVIQPAASIPAMSPSSTSSAPVSPQSASPATTAGPSVISTNSAALPLPPLSVSLPSSPLPPLPRLNSPSHYHSIPPRSMSAFTPLHAESVSFARPQPTPINQP